MKTLLSALFAATVLCSPAAAHDEYEDIHTIGVISAIGDEVRFRRPLDPSDSRSHWDMKISDWKLDEEIATKIGVLLSPRFTIRPVELDKSYFYRGPYGEGEHFHRRIQRYIQNVLKDPQVDAYIYIHKRFLPQMRGNPPNIFGLQVQYYKTIFSETPQPVTYAQFAVDVIDARTGATIDDTDPMIDGAFFHLEDPESHDAGLWADSESAYTAEQREKLRKTVFSLVMDNLPADLDSLHLISHGPKADAPASSSP